MSFIAIQVLGTAALFVSHLFVDVRNRLVARR
jgi:hypothetical protein